MLQIEIDNIKEKFHIDIATGDSITPKEIKEYFKKNPRTFNKIKPGFRPESLSDSDVFSIVESNRQEPFIEAYFDEMITVGYWYSSDGKLFFLAKGCFIK